MTKICLTFLGLIIATAVVADCQYYDGTQTATVKAGQSVSLRGPGKPLEKMKIQDQDGLGTCYANTTSTILKSVLPDNPDISYTHAAIMGTTRGWAEDWSEPGNKYLNKKRADDNFTSFGWVCETVAGLKNAGGACPQKHSAPENHEIWDSSAQKRLLSGLGLYFDKMNQIQNDPAKMEQLKKDLSLSIEAINLEKLSLIEQCEEKRSPQFPVYEAVKQLFQDALYDDIIESTNCTKAKADAIKKLLAPESIIGIDRVSVVPNPSVLKRFSDILTSDPDTIKELESFITTKWSDLSKQPELVNTIGKKFNNLLMELVPDEGMRKDCLESIPGKSVMIQDEISNGAESFLYQVKYHKESVCEDLLLAHDLDGLLDPTQNKKSCLAPTNVEVLLAALKPLMEIKTKLNQDLVPILLNPESRYANQIVQAIMPGCLNKEKLINMDNVACGTFPFCDPSGKFDDNNTYSGPEGGCYSLDHAKKMMRTKSLIGINSGRALGVGVCTAFMDDPSVKSNFCKTKLPNGDGHSLHEMTISGYRCVDNKIEYEIINSWGTGCNSNGNIECQTDEDGSTTGPFWVKEDALVDNSTDMTSITVKK